MNQKFSHIKDGKPTMVSVSNKANTSRLARARGKVHLTPVILEMLKSKAGNSPKGAVFQTAIIAGVMAAKKTGELIPLCHPLGLDHCDLQIWIDDKDIVMIECTATLTGKTGVEMEALTGVCIAALTIYDMCKALSHEIRISDIHLVEKRGGKKDYIIKS